MDDNRKRAAVSGDTDDSAPPLKRQATMTNGAGSNEAADIPKFGTINSSWQVDLETVQKDAILRQLKEYKREKQQLEQQVAELEKSSAHHDDHLRIIDAWWNQLIDEVRLLANDIPSQNSDPKSHTSSLLFANNEKFQEHLRSRSESIKTTITSLYSKLPTSQPDTQQLKSRVTELLAAEKLHIAELQKVTAEKEQLQNRLESASIRYLVAEKKLDRTKSQAVANLEKQGQVQAQALKTEPAEEKINGDAVNGIKEDVIMASEEAERERAEAIAVAEKTKEQLTQLEEQNSKLTKEITTLKVRLDSLSDEDFASTELFKIMKSQLEDSYNKLNDLEATHIQLREEAKKAQAERTAYRIKLDEEARAATSEAEAQLAKADADIQRIRAARDDLQTKNQILEASATERRATVEQATALAKAGDERIKALESEVERLRIQCGEMHAAATDEDLESLSAEELRVKIADLKQQCLLLSNELPSMEQAWQKARTLAANKVAQTAQWEDQLGLLKAEKAKAHQKYFGAMKQKEAQDNELLGLRKQNKVSSGIITSLKDNEAKYREMCTNLEKQVAEHKDTIITMTSQQQALEQKATQTSLAETGLQANIIKLKESLSERDSALSSAEHSRREAEQEVEALKIKLEVAKKKSEEWKKKANANSSEEVDMLRRVAYCSNCKENLKDTVISVCGHILCKRCVEDRISTRQRKCPMCMKAFGIKDYAPVHLV